MLAEENSMMCGGMHASEHPGFDSGIDFCRFLGQGYTIGFLPYGGPDYTGWPGLAVFKDGDTNQPIAVWHPAYRPRDGESQLPGWYSVVGSRELLFADKFFEIR